MHTTKSKWRKIKHHTLIWERLREYNIFFPLFYQIQTESCTDDSNLHNSQENWVPGPGGRQNVTTAQNAAQHSAGPLELWTFFIVSKEIQKTPRNQSGPQKQNFWPFQAARRHLKCTVHSVKVTMKQTGEVEGKKNQKENRRKLIYGLT